MVELPTLYVLKVTTRGAISHLSFNLGEVPHLRPQAEQMLRRALVGNTVGLGEPHFNASSDPDRPEILVELGVPTTDDRIIDSLVRTISRELGCRLELQTTSMEDTEAAALELLAQQGFTFGSEPPPRP